MYTVELKGAGGSPGDEVPVRWDTERLAYGGCGPVVSTAVFFGKRSPGQDRLLLTLIGEGLV